MPMLNTIRETLRHSVVRDALLLYRHRGLSENDVFLASYPKSGNTWLRHLLATLLGNSAEKDDWRSAISHVGLQVGNHFKLPGILKNGGRLIKTHESFRPVYGKTILLVRDGRDVVVSEFHYRRNYRPTLASNQSFDEFVERFLTGRTCGYGAWHEHTLSWLDVHDMRDHSLLCIRYEDLKADPEEELKRVREFLDLEATDEEIARAVEQNTVAAMRGREEKFWKDRKDKPAVSFVRSGKAGGWREHFSDASLERFYAVTGDVMRQLGYLSE